MENYQFLCFSGYILDKYDVVAGRNKNFFSGNALVSFSKQNMIGICLPHAPFGLLVLTHRDQTFWSMIHYQVRLVENKTNINNLKPF